MAKGDRWSLKFFDAKGNDRSRGWSTLLLTEAIRRVLLRFEGDPQIRYATVALNDHPFALIAVVGEFQATVAAIATDDATLNETERRALSHIENILHTGIRVHRRSPSTQWHLYRSRPTRP